LESEWVQGQCDAIAALIERARTIKLSANAARRGLAKIDETYEELRRDALEALDELRRRAEGSS
jgi:hypothetical protein